jgi:hypothetical protein
VHVQAFFAKLPPCLIGIEACASSHFWARELQAVGHTVRLIPPAYVKPYVKRQKNDTADAEAICEAVARPNMRFVPIKTRATMVYKFDPTYWNGTIFHLDKTWKMASLLDVWVRKEQLFDCREHVISLHTRENTNVAQHRDKRISIIRGQVAPA